MKKRNARAAKANATGFVSTKFDIAASRAILLAPCWDDSELIALRSLIAVGPMETEAGIAYCPAANIFAAGPAPLFHLFLFVSSTRRARTKPMHQWAFTHHGLAETLLITRRLLVKSDWHSGCIVSVAISSSIGTTPLGQHIAQ